MVLGLWAATGDAAVAIAEVGEPVRIIARASLQAPCRPAAALMPLVREALAAVSLRPGDLAAVAVAVGPGSYAGSRSAVATAQGLAYATGRPVLAVGSLQALAARASREPVIWAAIDARRERVYAAAYHWEGGRLLPVHEPQLLPRARFWELVRSAATPPAVALGPGIPAAEAPDPALVHQGSGDAAEAVAGIGATAWRDGLATDPMGLTVIYGSDPDIGPPAAHRGK